MLWPQTPAGRQAQAWLARFNSGDAQVFQAFIDKAAAEAYRTQHQPIDYAWCWLHSRGYAASGVVDSAPHRIVFRTRDQIVGQPYHITLTVGQTAPHRITGVTISHTPLDDPPPTLASAAATIEALATADVFSGVVLVTRGDSVLLESVQGLANRRYAVPNTIDTRFNIGSINKAFTAAAIMQLASNGVLRVDDRLDPYWPHAPSAAVTLHHLLTHTSGFGSVFTEDFFSTARDRFSSLADFQPLLAEQTLSFSPGSEWQYSNVGYLLLGLVIEAATGADYHDVVRDLVFTPAGMTATGSPAWDAPIPKVAIGYTRFGVDWQPVDMILRSNLFLGLYRGTSDGGGLSTVWDLTRFAAALYNGSLPGVARLLQRSVTTGQPDEHRYGYGLESRTIDGVQVVGHNGGFPGVAAQLDFFPTLGITSVVLANCDYPGPRIVWRELRRAIAQGEKHTGGSMHGQ
ncbi:MAG: beta-lactamase family protein [Chloroflexi bacterium]|nr:beta-lactamase family protein [Chloroflexota bacterium]